MNIKPKVQEALPNAQLCCPFCGGTDLRDGCTHEDPWTWCKNQKCPIYDVEIRVQDWNNRAT